MTSPDPTPAARVAVVWYPVHNAAPLCARGLALGVPFTIIAHWKRRSFETRFGAIMSTFGSWHYPTHPCSHDLHGGPIVTELWRRLQKDRCA